MTNDHDTANRLGHLLNQVRWVTRISVALSSAVRVEDVYSVLLSGLLSPLGLGYSYAMVFEVDTAHSEIVGKIAVGFDDRAQIEDMRAELESETEFLENRRLALAARAEEDESAAEELRTLELGSQWVTVYQRLGTEDPATQAISALHYTTVPRAVAGHRMPTIFQTALRARAPFMVAQNINGAASATTPEELRALLPGQYAVLPLHSNKGLRSVILLDRRVTGEPITRDDLESLEWFSTQGALALQNAELIADLENAYKELKAVDQMKSNFLSIISHELRTPLTAITGFVELILNQKVGLVNDAQKNLLTRVAKNTGHLNNMVNDLIEIAEIEAEGMNDVVLAAVDPLNTLFATLPKLEYRRRDNKVEIEPVFTGEIPNILCDERALERIYFHLLDNAVKFSPTGEVVQIEFQRVDEGHLAISIVDHGEGIPKDKRQRIFEEFYQIDNTLTRSHEGLGLGLAVTRILVQATHGEIQVSSVVGKGSRFTLIYPISVKAMGRPGRG